MLLRPLFFMLAVAATGCATNVTNRYSASAENVSALRAISPQKLSVGSFTQSSSIPSDGVICVGKPTIPPDGNNFAEYIRLALISELKMADLYSENAPNQITGEITSIENDASMIDVNASWLISMRLKSKNSEIEVSDRYSFKAVTGTMDSCSGSAYRFADAVQNLLGKAIKSPEFIGLVKPK